MKVYVDPPAHLSQAMYRVAKALKRYAPLEVEIVETHEEADLQVLHAIGLDALDINIGKFAVIQYCLDAVAREDGVNVPIAAQWEPLWKRASVVWSYYDLPSVPAQKFYLAPLGVDGKVFKMGNGHRPTGVMTSGYVAGPGAEAIEEVALAAERLGLSTVHLGPVPDTPHGPMQVPPNWRAFNDVPDSVLAHEYGQSRWVSGLRHIEGFELPVLEGLVCGARPIVFDRLDMRQWYDGHVRFVPECHGEALVDVLMNVMSGHPEPVTEFERQRVLTKFNWQTIAEGFWSKLLEVERA